MTGEATQPTTTAPKPMYDTRVPDALETAILLALLFVSVVATGVAIWLVVLIGGLPAIAAMIGTPAAVALLAFVLSRS